MFEIFFSCDEDVRVVEHDLHALAVRHEVRRQVAAVELHTLDDVELGGHRLGLLDGDHAFLADLLHRLGDHLADLGVAVRADRADLRDVFLALGRGRHRLDLLDDRRDRGVDAALEVHRVQAGGDELRALVVDRLREHGRGGGAVTGDVGLAQHWHIIMRPQVDTLCPKMCSECIHFPGQE